MKKIANKTGAALWFSKSFALHVVAITFKEVNTGVVHTSSMSTDGPENKDSFDEFANNQQEKLGQILLLLDTFCVGIQFTTNLQY